MLFLSYSDNYPFQKSPFPFAKRYLGFDFRNPLKRQLKERIMDSIDSIELIVLLSREYGISIQDPKEGRKIMTDINTLVGYIEKKQNQVNNAI